MADETLPEGAEALLKSAGYNAPYAVSKLVGGRNNQVFEVTAAGKKAVLKAYFHDPEDPRDRLTAEHDFLRAAAQLGVTCVARVLGRDPGLRLGLYSHLEGARPEPTDVTPAAVEQGLRFVLALNPRDGRQALPPLPFASEAGRTNAEHFAGVDRRLDRLMAGVGPTAIEQDAARFLQDEVKPLWDRLRDDARQRLQGMGIDLAATIAGEDLLLSPSDFGFHNALKAGNGTFAFLDFEYAGWDDPAKLIGDAFNQVRLPLPRDAYQTFRDALAARSRRPELEAQRYDVIRPAYAVRWITIMLNEFQPAGTRRRAFAEPEEPLDQRRASQLGRAREKLARLAGELKI